VIDVPVPVISLLPKPEAVITAAAALFISLKHSKLVISSAAVRNDPPDLMKSLLRHAVVVNRVFVSILTSMRWRPGGRAGKVQDKLLPDRTDARTERFGLVMWQVKCIEVIRFNPLKNTVWDPSALETGSIRADHTDGCTAQLISVLAMAM
jgi:hypothetical protein